LLRQFISQRLKLSLVQRPAAANNPNRSDQREQEAQQSQADVLKALLRGAVDFADRVGLFVVKNDQAIGWRLAKVNDPDLEMIGGVSLPLTAQTIGTLVLLAMLLVWYPGAYFAAAGGEAGIGDDRRCVATVLQSRTTWFAVQMKVLPLRWIAMPEPYPVAVSINEVSVWATSYLFAVGRKNATGSRSCLNSAGARVAMVAPSSAA
jgi:hypothetical protein